ncbi:MAG: hypothetical protein ABIQ30_06635 [Devosia sp.]
MGHSVGAFIAASLALDANWSLASDPERAVSIQGMVGLLGPYTGIRIKRGQLPQVALLSAGRDRLVPVSVTLALASSVTAAGGQAEHRV